MASASTDTPAKMDIGNSSEDSARNEALANYRKKLLEHREVEDKVKQRNFHLSHSHN